MIENILFFVVKNIFFQSRLWNFMIEFINSGQLMVTDVKLLWKRGELITRRVVMLSGLLDRWKKLCYMVILFSLFFVPKNYLLLRMGKFLGKRLNLSLNKVWIGLMILLKNIL